MGSSASTLRSSIAVVAEGDGTASVPRSRVADSAADKAKHPQYRTWRRVVPARCSEQIRSSTGSPSTLSW
eukprot:3205959-Rhodomonas_salina.2